MTRWNRDMKNNRILSLIGIAKSGSAVGPDDDEKLNYILSK